MMMNENEISSENYQLSEKQSETLPIQLENINYRVSK